MLRAAAPLIHRPAALSSRLCCQRLRNMAGFSIPDDHPKNYVFGDKLERDQDLPYSKSPALEFQVRATDGQARAAQMQLPHFLCETPMFMPVGTQGAALACDSDASWPRQAPPCSQLCRHSQGAHTWDARGLQVPPHPRQHLPLGQPPRSLSHRGAGRLAQVLGLESSNVDRLRCCPQVGCQVPKKHGPPHA